MVIDDPEANAVREYARREAEAAEQRGVKRWQTMRTSVQISKPNLSKRCLSLWLLRVAPRSPQQKNEKSTC